MTSVDVAAFQASNTFFPCIHRFFIVLFDVVVVIFAYIILHFIPYM